MSRQKWLSLSAVCIKYQSYRTYIADDVCMISQNTQKEIIDNSVVIRTKAELLYFYQRKPKFLVYLNAATQHNLYLCLACCALSWKPRSS